MPASPLTLTSAVKRLGKAVPLIGDWTIAASMAALGATEGPITVSGIGSPTISGLTADEHTGGLLHRATSMPGAPQVNIPVIVGDPALWAKITPTGSEDGPADNPMDVVTTGLWLVPLAAFPISGTPPVYGSIGYNGTAWSPVGVNLTDELKNALLFGKGFFNHPDQAFDNANGGKNVVTASYMPMYDERLPAGKRGWIRGDPVTKGLTTFRI
jgi:hypothetical protein